MTLAPGPKRLRAEGRLLGAAAGVLVVLLVAVLTHLLAILMIPRVATEDAYHALAARSRINTLTVLASSRPGDTLVPFRDPATIEGLCFFDVTKAPVRVRTRTEDGRLLTLSFRTPEGRVFYSMTDRAAYKDTIDIRLVTPTQLAAIEDADTSTDEGPPTELRLKVPQAHGLMVATVLVGRPSERRDAEARVAAITCAAEPLPPPAEPAASN